MSARRVLLVLLAAALVPAFVWRSWVGAQARAWVVLSTTLQTPVLTWLAKAVTTDPHAVDTLVAGAPTTIVRPGGSGPWPTLVFVNGATERGRRHPDVQRLARGLARAGWLVLVPDLPGLRRGEITLRTLRATEAVAATAVRWRTTRGGRIGFLGVSVGASLALLTAEDPVLAGRVTVVAGIAPYTELVDVARLATTGYHLEQGRLVPYRHDPFVLLAVARSLAAGLPPGPDRLVLVERLAAVSNTDADPLGALSSGPAVRLGPGGRAVVALLLNRDPSRFDSLLARLPASLRSALRELSPIVNARRLTARVELATAPHDKYFPAAGERALARVAPHVDVTVTRTLDHAIPRPSLTDLLDLFRFDGFVVRALHDARA